MISKLLVSVAVWLVRTLRGWHEAGPQWPKGSPPVIPCAARLDAMHQTAGQTATLLDADRFAAAFSSGAILQRLCRERTRLAGRRGREAWLDFFGTCRPIEQLDFEGLLPPRSDWHAFRPRKSERLDPESARALSLWRAANALSNRNPQLPWVRACRDAIQRIQGRVLVTDAFAFESPRVIADVKDARARTYRPISVLDWEEKLVDGLTARYLRDEMDSLFDPASLAFRNHAKGKRVDVLDEAVAQIEHYRSKHGKYGLFVAEVDIYSFFDCLGHKVIRSSMEHALNRLARLKQTSIDPRALTIFDAFLASYRFPSNVLGSGLVQLRQRDLLGTFPWPESQLTEFYAQPRAEHIGVPQGAALSGITANLVLDYADQKVRSFEKATHAELLYLRYCDDAIILAPKLEVATAALKHYCAALHELKLPAHPPETVGAYGPSYWTTKSKAPFLWANKSRPGAMPWVRFLGREMRWDGAVRISAKSIAKHHARVRGEVDRFLGHARRSSKMARVKQRSVPISTALNRLARHLANLSVGRKGFRQRKIGARRGWLAAWSGLARGSNSTQQMKWLDRFRERQLHRAKTALIRTTRQRVNPVAGRIVHSFPTSYFAHWVNRPTQQSEALCAALWAKVWSRKILPMVNRMRAKLINKEL